MNHLCTRLNLVAGISGGALAAHVLPATLFVPPVRRRCWPALAGLGRPDHVALTFDDGPHPRSTPHFLRALQRSDTQATFFLLATALRQAPSLGRQLVAAGHDIGVHGWDHHCLLRHGPAAIYRQLAQATQTITELTGQRPRWFRPTYGVLTGVTLLAARRLDLTPVLWTNWGYDWTATATAASVQARVQHRLTGGATILLHDSDIAAAPGAWRATLTALPGLLAHCAQRDLTVGPLTEHGLRPRPDARTDGNPTHQARR